MCLVLASGADAKNCTVSFEASPAAQSLLLSLATQQHIKVGTVTQDCKKAVSYSLIVESAACPLTPAGAKLMGGIGGEFVRYSVEFANKIPGGGVVSVSGLLAQICAAQVARYEGHAYGLRRSDVFVDFTGSELLAEGTYSDTLSVTLNIN